MSSPVAKLPAGGESYTGTITNQGVGAGQVGGGGGGWGGCT